MFYEVSFPQDIARSNLASVEAVFAHWYGKSGRAWCNRDKHRFIILDQLKKIQMMVTILERSCENLDVREIDVDDTSLTKDEREWMVKLENELHEVLKLYKNM